MTDEYGVRRSRPAHRQRLQHVHRASRHGPRANAAELHTLWVAAQCKDLTLQSEIVAGNRERWSGATQFARSGGPPRRRVAKQPCGESGSIAAARILQAPGDMSVFPIPAHLAAHAGITPVIRRSGTASRGGPRQGREQAVEESRDAPRPPSCERHAPDGSRTPHSSS